eukprot:5791421-Amphidinium_carterae.1
MLSVAFVVFFIGAAPPITDFPTSPKGHRRTALVSMYTSSSLRSECPIASLEPGMTMTARLWEHSLQALRLPACVTRSVKASVVWCRWRWPAKAGSW